MCLVGDFVTPLKKRRMARESLSIDDSIPGATEDDENSTVTPPGDAVSSLPAMTSRSLIDEAGSDLSVDAHDEMWSRVGICVCAVACM